MSEEEVKNAGEAAKEESGGIGGKILGGLGSVKDKIAGTMDADGDGKIEAEDFKDNAAKLGGKIKDGIGGLGSKIKNGLGKPDDNPEG